MDGGTHTTGWNLLTLADTPAAKPGPRVQFFLGVDGLNVWLVALCSLMMLPAVLTSWAAITERPGAFYAWLFVLQAGAVGAFLSFDVILFYAFFELTLIPAFFLIGRWGAGSGRRDAARRFVLYTLAGSLLTLVGIVGVVLTNPITGGGQAGAVTTYTFSIPELMAAVQLNLMQPHIDAIGGKPEALAARQAVQFWLFLALMAGFAVKTPIAPLHTWLPAAYGEAPAGVTVFLSAVLAKLGAFGILRLVIPLTPDAAVAYGLPVVETNLWGGILVSIVCSVVGIVVSLPFGISHRDADPSDPGDWVTGAEASSPTFAGCFVENSSWHGTFIAGQIAAVANNGIGIRTPAEGDAAYVGMEIQVLDNTAKQYATLKPYQYHGSVYGIAPAKREFQKPVGEWNVEEIVADGRHVKVTLNGEVIVDVNLDEATKAGTMDGKEHPGLKNAKGHIAFCGHGDRVMFRNLRVKTLR